MKFILFSLIFVAQCITSHTTIYSGSLQDILRHLQQHTDEKTAVFAQADLPDMHYLLTKDIQKILKQAQTLCARGKRIGYELISSINTSMKQLSPIYVSVAHLVPTCIGMTRRSLRWSHLMRGQSRKKGINLPTERKAVTIETDDPDYPDIIECNTGILYLDSISSAQAIDTYQKTWLASCSHLIIINTDKTALRTCLHQLSGMTGCTLTGLLVKL